MWYAALGVTFLVILLVIFSYYEEKIEKLEECVGLEPSGDALVRYDGKQLKGQYFVQDDDTILVYINEDILY